jgi:hypothetical protein
MALPYSAAKAIATTAIATMMQVTRQFSIYPNPKRSTQTIVSVICRFVHYHNGAFELSLNQASEALTRHAYRQVVRQFLFVPVRGRDDCAFRPSTCHFLIKERADRLRAAKLRLRNIDISGFNSDRRNEAAMRVDHLVHKAGLTQGDASEIEVATQNSGGHDAKADCRDLRRESELGSVNIEKVAQLASFTPPVLHPTKN